MYYFEVDPNSSDYEDFIRSSRFWQRVQEKYWKSTLPKYCWICFSFKRIQLHHEDYAVLGHELEGDNLRKFISQCKIVPVCNLCHNLLTFDEVGEKIPQKFPILRERRLQLRKLYIKDQLLKLRIFPLIGQWFFRLIY